MQFNILSEAKNLFVDKSILSLIIFLGNINISRQGEIPDRRKSFYSIARNPRSGGTGEIPVPTVRQSDCQVWMRERSKK